MASIWFIVLSATLYIAILAGAAWLASRRRKSRWPFKDADKLLRGPGETLKRRVAEIDERFIYEFLGGWAAGLLAFCVIALAALKMGGLTDRHSFYAGTIGLVACMAISGWRIVRLLRERTNYFLGWFGERYVAEKMEPMRAHGWRIFHDVPAGGGSKGFNLDHVALGSKGIAVIETKTRRKGRARPGFEDYVVVYDGQKLIWPWGEDQHGLAQAKAEADWLRKWIQQCTGIDTPVKPILALPGWFVKPQGRGAVSVVNPSWKTPWLAEAVEANGDSSLTAQQIDLIARQLDARCRDVED
jgi:hypothetical protein